MIGEQEPFVGSEPDGRQVVRHGGGVGGERELDAEYPVDGGQRFGVAGVQAQVEVGEEGAFDELFVVRGRRRGLDGAEG